MRKGSIIAGVACGIVCVVCVLMYASLVQGEADAARAEAMERYGGEQVDVLVASKDIYPGESLNSSNTTTQTWLSDLLPDGCMTDLSQADGLQATSLIIEGEVVCSRRFQTGASELEVPEGCAALSVPAKDVQAVGGALTSGSLVDVYAVGTSTTRIGEKILVLATSAEGDGTTQGSVSWVTLAVPVDQSQEFVTASQSMSIYFVLPSATEEETASIGADEADEGESEDTDTSNESTTSKEDA